MKERTGRGERRIEEEGMNQEEENDE